MPAAHRGLRRAVRLDLLAAPGWAPFSEGTGRRPRVYIVDDHRLFVLGLTSLLVDSGKLEVCGSSCEPQQVVRDVGRLRPDLVIMDVQLRDTDGLTIAESLRRTSGAIPILFLSSLADPAVRRRAELLGARGFLDKTQEPERILKGIKRALAR